MKQIASGILCKAHRARRLWFVRWSASFDEAAAAKAGSMLQVYLKLLLVEFVKWCASFADIRLTGRGFILKFIMLEIK
jgi:hypothetical protein